MTSLPTYMGRAPNLHKWKTSKRRKVTNKDLYESGSSYMMDIMINSLPVYGVVTFCPSEIISKIAAYIYTHMNVMTGLILKILGWLLDQDFIPDDP